MKVGLNYKLTISYDGTSFSGWQIQPNGISIQQLIEQAIKVILRNPVKVVGAGRTDAGVHALAQIAHFFCEVEIDPYKFINSVNALLPKEIRIKKIERVSPDFHAQRSAAGKIYHYHLWLDKVQSPFHRLYTYHVHEKIDLALLKQAATQFIGTHDFTSFANEAHAGAAQVNPVRCIKRLDVVPQDGGVRLEFEGDGFLYKMVRNIVGTLIEVARGKRTADEIEQIFLARDRRKAGTAVPPHGLFLVEVFY